MSARRPAANTEKSTTRSTPSTTQNDNAPTEQPYHIKYRPLKLAHVVGQPDIVSSLKRAVSDRSRQHTYFFLGPTGCGKTTLARIMCGLFDVPASSIVEVDGASQRGIDDMKTVVQNLRYAGFGDHPNKAVIIDECHQLSKDAWDSLLKITEEPPEHVFFFFCSTNAAKVPAAMLTRGPQYALLPVRYDDIMDLLEFVDEEEELETSKAHLEIVARACGGSPRQALVQLAMIQGARDEDECSALLQGVGQQKEVIDLCRRMVQNSLTWKDVQMNLKPLADLGAEGIRIQVSLYLSAVLMGNVKPKETGRLLDMLDAFSKPCNQTDKLAPILLAFGQFADF